MMEVDQDEKNRLFAQIRTEKGTSLQEYGFCFYDPLNSEIELIPDGANVPVTLESLQQYIDLVVD